jgi:hemerythrin-like domain-containing protein
MLATEILMSEHRVIERVIEALDTAARRVEAGQAVRADFFVDGARFIRHFADGYHHGKEEGVLFEAMAQAGMPMDDGPIGMMVYEHEHARDITRRLNEAAARLAAGEREAVDAVVEQARAYGELLTHHIYKEDNILFPMAEHAIVPQEQDRVLTEFERVEREQAANGSKASYVELARTLCDEMGAVLGAAATLSG